MTTYDPDCAVQDLAADAMNDAISLCKAAGWSASDAKGFVSHLWEMNEAATPTPKEPKDGA